MEAQNSVNPRAVLSVAGASLSLFCTVGFLNAFGVFQQHYKASILRNKSESDISWIGSVAIFLLYLFAPITGILVDRFGPRLRNAPGHLHDVFVREPRQPQQAAPTTLKSPSPTGSDSELPKQNPIEASPVADKKKVEKGEVAALVKNPVFIYLAAGLAMVNVGLFVPLFYISSYATNNGIDPQMSFYLISIINGASLVGRVVPGHLADRFGHYNVCFLAAFLSAVTAFCITAARNLGGLVVISLVYGFTSGAILAVQGACVAKIVGIHMQGTAMGLLMGCLAVATLIGVPIGGALLTRFGYLSVCMFTGATLITGSILIAVARLLLKRNVFSAI